MARLASLHSRRLCRSGSVGSTGGAAPRRAPSPLAAASSKGGLVEVNRSIALPRLGLAALAAAALMALAALVVATNVATARRRRPRTSPTCRSPSRTATTHRCSPPRRRSPPAGGAKVTVFDAANDPKKQLSQLQTAIASGQYQAIIVQPIYGPQLIPTVKQAISKGIKVVNIDQILGTNPGTAAPPVKGTVRQRRVRPDADRPEAGQAARRRLREGRREPVQRRVPLLGEGHLARHRDPQRRQLGHQGPQHQDRRRGRDLLPAGRRR